jgi:hypothetical protein
LGYDRNDPSTIKEECLPIISAKGSEYMASQINLRFLTISIAVIQHYGVCHEDAVWQLRQEPGVVGAFEKVYGTDDLIVSFDAVNISFAK